MKAIIGLGNPGKKYENTWHNIGFLAIDNFLKDNNFPDFKTSGKFNALASEQSFNNEKIILVKPQTYMNESGRTVKQIMDYYKLTGREIIIIHDDIDILQGKIKISSDRGSAGHKGVDSIFNYTGGTDFIRLRIGINPDIKKTRKAMDVVLKNFSEAESKKAKKAVKKATDALACLLEGGLEKAMSQYNA